jgi:hypothetical protein
MKALFVSPPLKVMFPVARVQASAGELGPIHHTTNSFLAVLQAPNEARDDKAVSLPTLKPLLSTYHNSEVNHGGRLSGVRGGVEPNPTGQRQGGKPTGTPPLLPSCSPAGAEEAAGCVQAFAGVLNPVHHTGVTLAASPAPDDANLESDKAVRPT